MAHAVWLYFRFPLILRLVVEMLLKRGIVVSISGEKRYLWRAVDQDGYLLDKIVQVRRNTKAAQRLLERLLHKQGCRPRRLVTDKLGFYAVTRWTIMPSVEHRSQKGLNKKIVGRKRHTAVES
jgi:putative transposase